MSRDHLTPSERSAHMRRVRKAGTQPEMVVRQLAHAMGLRFRLQRRDLPGTPDLVLPKHRVAVMVHGCFWHQHEGCRLSRPPKTRLEYWIPKLARNRERDEAVVLQLEALGWKVITIWGCETRSVEVVRERLLPLLRSRDGTIAAD